MRRNDKMRKYELFYFVVWMAVVLVTLWLGLKMFTDFKPIRTQIEGKMGRYGVTVNMTLEEACVAGLDAIDGAQNHGLNRHSTVEELLDKIF